MVRRSLAQAAGVLAVLAFTCLPATAAIAFDAVTVGNGSALIGTPFSLNHTTSGSDRALVCITNVNPSATITATYNSVAMTLVHVDGRDRFFFLSAPTTGTNAAAFTTDGDTAIYVACASYTGVSQSGQPAVAAEENITGLSNSNKHVVNITTSTTAWLVMGTVGYVEDRDPQSDDATFRDASVSGVVAIFDSNGDVSSGANSRNWYYNTATTSDGYAVIIALEPAGAAPPSACVSRILMLGVGGCL